MAVPSNSHGQTLATGPQLSYRHFKKVTLFIRPSIGAIHEVATPSRGIRLRMSSSKRRSPPGRKSTGQPFNGFGGRADFLFSKHVGLRVQADLVYDHLFSDILKDGRLTTRFSIGPCFNFGKNILK